MSEPGDSRHPLSHLARERPPDPMLEERTVRELQRQRLLRRPGRFGLPLSDRWLAATAAVVVSCLLGAFGVGYWQGSRQTKSAMIAMHQQDGRQAVAALRAAGASYLSALADLTRRSAVANPEDREAIRRAAHRSLSSVVEEMVRLAPDDPLATGILQALDRPKVRGESTSTEAGHRQEIVWF